MKSGLSVEIDLTGHPLLIAFRQQSGDEPQAGAVLGKIDATRVRRLISRLAATKPGGFQERQLAQEIAGNWMLYPPRNCLGRQDLLTSLAAVVRLLP